MSTVPTENPAPSRDITTTRKHKLSRHQLAVVFLLALAVRMLWGLARLTSAADPLALEFPDESQYWLMAENLHQGVGLQDELGFQATRMPLYPALLSLFTGTPHGVVAAKVFHWLLGALVALLTAGAAASTLGQRVGFLAGILVAFDPFLTFFSSLLLSETPFLCAEVALVWSGVVLSRGENAHCWRRWTGFAVLASLCIYLRESSVVLVGLMLLWLMLSIRPRRTAALRATFAALLILLSLLPWALRNHRVTGDWCLLTHRGGVSLYDGVGPQANGSSNLGQVQHSADVQGFNEVQWNNHFLHESWRAIVSDPARVLRLVPIKLARLWNPFPNVETYQSAAIRAISAFWTIPIYALALAGVALVGTMKPGRGPSVAVLLLLPAITVTALHCVFVGSVRYRLVAMPLLEVLAAYTLVFLYGKARSRRNAEAHSHDIFS